MKLNQDCIFKNLYTTLIITTKDLVSVNFLKYMRFEGFIKFWVTFVVYSYI